MSFKSVERLSKRTMLAQIACEGNHVLTEENKKQAVMVARNTLAYFDCVGVHRYRYHNTDIITTWPDKLVTIDTGGYNTVTTLRRLHCLIGRNHFIETEKGELFCDGVPFNRTVTIKLNGEYVTDSTWTLEERQNRKISKLVRQIIRYEDAFWYQNAPLKFDERGLMDKAQLQALLDMTEGNRELSGDHGISTKSLAEAAVAWRMAQRANGSLKGEIAAARAILGLEGGLTSHQLSSKSATIKAWIKESLACAS